jgi:hypothetical protein
MWSMIVVLAFFALAVASEIEWKAHPESDGLTTAAVSPIQKAPAEAMDEWAAILEHVQRKDNV